MRFILVLVLLLAVASPAAATPITKIVVAPSGADPNQQYYLRATLSTPESPSSGATDPCAGGPSAPSTQPSLPAPGIPNSASPFVPRCVQIDSPSGCGTPFGCGPSVPASHVSYNVTNGNYSASFLTPSKGVAGADVHGSSGLGLEADCETCPPPVCC